MLAVTDKEREGRGGGDGGRETKCDGSPNKGEETKTEDETKNKCRTRENEKAIWHRVCQLAEHKTTENK